MSRQRRKKTYVNRKPGRQYNWNRKQMQRNVKDRLFRYLFVKEPDGDREGGEKSLWNRTNNKQLMEKCRILEEYSKLVAVIRDCMAVEKDIQTALNWAVDSCIEKGILKEFLLKNRAEVLGMLLEEFDVEKYERTIRSEGEVKVNRLGLLLTEAGRSSEFLKSLSDRELQKKLFVEFGLEEG